MTSIKVEGLSEVRDALRQLPKATAKNVVRRVLKVRGKVIADAAIQRVPVLQGGLKKSIVVTTTLTRSQRGQYKKEGPKDIDVFIGPNSHPKAHMQEYGTSHAPAQPYMRPAWDESKAGIVQGLADDMWIEIEKAVSRAARKAAKK